MSRDQVPSAELLAFADVLLWSAGFLRPSRRGESARSHPEPSEVDALDELCRRTGLVERGWSGANLAALETGFGSESGTEAARLFEGAILCPPNETGFIRRDKGHILADLEGFYRAFGFRLSGRVAEKGDHIVSELEFVALLLVMLARAKDHEAAAITGAALADFARDHLGEWLPLFCDRLANVASSAPYVDLARLLLISWTRLADRLGLPASECPGEAAPADGFETPYECGMLDEQDPLSHEFPV